MRWSGKADGVASKLAPTSLPGGRDPWPPRELSKVSPKATADGGDGRHCFL
jgi:hypothetical protein